MAASRSTWFRRARLHPAVRSTFDLLPQQEVRLEHQRSSVSRTDVSVRQHYVAAAGWFVSHQWQYGCHDRRGGSESAGRYELLQRGGSALYFVTSVGGECASAQQRPRQLSRQCP